MKNSITGSSNVENGVNLAPIRVLVVDDDGDFAHTTKDFLESQGEFLVDTVLSVGEAARKLATTEYDIVVSDYKMGEKDGLQFLQELKQDSNAVPFVLFTGKGREEVAIKALNLGVDGYFTKHGVPETVFGELMHGIRRAVRFWKVQKQVTLAAEEWRKTFDAIQDLAFIINKDHKLVRVNKSFCAFLKKKPEELVGKYCYDVLHGIHEPLPNCLIEKTLITGKATTEEIDASTLDMTLLITNSPIFDDKGKIVNSVHIAKDITERKKAEKKLVLYGRLQAAIAELGQYTLVETNLDKLLNKTVQIVTNAMGVEYCKILELLPKGDALLLRAGVGWKEGLVGTVTVNTDKTSLAGYTLRCSTPVIMEDIRTEKRFSGQQLLRDHNVISGLSVVIGSIKNPFGVIGVHTNRQHHFSEDDVNFMLAIANLLAQVVERKRMDNALRMSEEKYRELINNMNDMVWVVNFDGKFLDANDAAVKVLGYSKEELLSMSITDIDSRLSKEQIINLIQKLPADKTQVFETEHTAKDGKKVPVEISSSIVTFQGKQVILSIARDTTERKQLAKALKVQNAMFEDLYENAPTMYFSMDAELIFTMANKTMCQVLGYAKEELVGKHYSLILSTKSKAVYEKAYSAYLEKGHLMGVERQFVRKDGSVIDVVGDVSAEYKDGKLLYNRAVFRDVTKQKQIEQLNRQLVYQLNNLSNSASYLVESHELAFKIFADLTMHGVTGLCIAREDPEKLTEAYGVKVEQVRLLASKPFKGFSAIADLQAVSFAISEFLKANSGGVVLLDGLEYLVSIFGFDSVYRFIQEKRFDFLEGGALLLVPLDMATLSEREKALLLSELSLLTGRSE